MPNLKFKRLTISDWRQFRTINLEIHERLTVITGSNGSGKSTLLNIFAQHFGWQRPYLATPRRIRTTGEYNYVTGWRRKSISSVISNPNLQELGVLSYSNNSSAALQAPSQTGVQFHLQIPNQTAVQGLHIPSHRTLPFYQQVTSIPTNALSVEQSYTNYFNETMQRYNGGHTQFGPAYRLKESLISMATFGAGNQFVQGNPSALQAYLEFENILRKILPRSLGFQKLAIRTPDVVLVTDTGEFLIDAASGGVMSLIDLAWQIHLFSTKTRDDFVITMDEPENHLHPSMQRSLLADLLSAFPRAQFIVVTHSPFMVSSVKDSNVYVLDYVEDGSAEDFEDSKDFDHEPATKVNRKVVSQKLDTVNRAGTANEILREVLGVPATIPEWVEKSLGEIVLDFKRIPISNDSLNDMRARLDSLGFGELYSSAVSELVRGQ